MIDRRWILGSLAAASSVAAAGALHVIRDDGHTFHLPLAPETALWRELVRLRPPRLGDMPELAVGAARLDGMRVTLRGYMLALAEAPRHEHFTLTANPLGCPACAPDRPGMRLRIGMRRSVETTGRPLTLTGTFRITHSDGLPYALTDAIVL